MSYSLKSLWRLGKTKDIIEYARSCPEDHLEEVYRRIEKNEKNLNAYITILRYNDILNQLKNSDSNGRLYGVLIAVKDNITTKGIRTTAASKMLENYIPPYDATAVERIKKEQCIIVGKTNMDEFACGSDGTRSAFGPTHNPWDLERVPGGSSSGSGAAVASGMCDLALGSDTGGSIRCPSCFCGVFGLKPTYGLVSRYGLLDMAMSLEQIGPMARDTYGVALLLDIISGKDLKDPTTVEKPEKNYTSFVEDFDESKLKGRKVAYAKEFLEYADDGVKRLFFKTLDYLNSLGLEITEISIPEVHYAVPTYYLLVFSEFSSAMQKYDGLKYGHRHETQDLWKTIMKSRAVFGEEVKRRIILGTYITSREQFGKWYKKAVLVRMKIRQRILSLFEEYDYIVSPTMPNVPWRIGEKSKNPLEMYQEDVLTVLPNICGTPAASVPMGSVNGLPTGFQIMSDYFAEPKILELMKAIEQKFEK